MGDSSRAMSYLTLGYLTHFASSYVHVVVQDGLHAAYRELREETGIVWENFEEVSRTVRDCYATIFYSYLCTVDWPKDQIRCQEGETEGYQWLSEEEFIELLNSGRMIPGQPERMESWFRKMGYLR